MIESKRGNKQALFLFEPRSFVPLATVQDNKTYWYQCDQVGAPQELTDREGNIVWAADYKVWGEATLRKTGTDGSVRYARQPEPPSPVLEQPFRFQGQQFDEESGLHYNRYRYYDPGVGRFVSQDPIGLRGGSNLFAYAPNPLGWVDPFGLAKKQNNPNCPSCYDWSSKRVRDASKDLDQGATEVHVGNRSEAEELFLGKYQGQGYSNTTSMSPTETKDFFGGKSGTYHWDEGAKSYPHEADHLQVHTHEGDVIRIYFQ
jgi:RHS repeat-associated protein